MIISKFIEVTEGYCDLCGWKLSASEMVDAKLLKVDVSLTIYDSRPPRVSDLPNGVELISVSPPHEEKIRYKGAIMCSECKRLIDRMITHKKHQEAKKAEELTDKIMQAVDVSEEEEE